MGETDLKVIVKAKDLAEHSFKLISNCNRYPKKYRHSLVDRIQVRSLDIHDTLLEANRINNVTHKRERCETITKAITYCDQLLFYIGNCYGLGRAMDEKIESVTAGKRTEHGTGKKLDKGRRGVPC